MMLRRRSASRDHSQLPKSDSKRPLLSPLFTQFSSPETRHTHSPGSIDYNSARPRLHDDGDAVDAPEPKESPSDKYRYDPGEAGYEDHELEDLAKGVSGAGHHLDTKKQSEFMQHANRSLHSLLSRHDTFREHGGTDSGPPTSTSQYLPGHILAAQGSSTDDYADLETLKPARNAHDEYITHQRTLFPNSEGQAKENTQIIGKMHQWMDEILEMQEGIAAMHMQLESVGLETDDHAYGLREKLEDKHLADNVKSDQSRSQDDGSGNGKEKKSHGEEVKDKKREDDIMDKMIQKLYELSKKLQDFHATPHPTISFPNSKGSDSRANVLPDLPKTDEVGGDSKKQDGSPFHNRTNDTDLPLKNPSSNRETVPDGVQGMSSGISADPDHARNFLLPEHHHDFARDSPPSIPKESTTATSKQTEDEQSPSTPMNPSKPNTAMRQQQATRSRPVAGKPPMEPADLRRQVLQSYDRARWESVDMQSPVTPADDRISGNGGRPSPARAWSTVLED